MNDIIKNRIKESIEIKQRLLNDEELIEDIEIIADRLITSLREGHKLILCGNGGSASDALHFAGEIVGRFQIDRNPWPAVVLNSDVATLTAIANDYEYDDVFARQAKAHCQPGDVFIGISTSGNSENVYRAAQVAKENGSITAALLGKRRAFGYCGKRCAHQAGDHRTISGKCKRKFHRIGGGGDHRRGRRCKLPV